jgi:hypothetical protein
MLRPAAGAFVLAVQWILGTTSLLRDALERWDNTLLCVCVCVCAVYASVCVCMRTVSRVMGCCQISTRRV